MSDATLERAAEYWKTGIIDTVPGVIRMRGYPIQELMGAITFPEMIWLMLRGELPQRPQALLLEAALVSSVDHGPHSPAIAISRIATSCGLPLNGAMASALNVLGDVHGGAGEQAAELFLDIDRRISGGADLAAATNACLDAFFATSGKFIPGYGHRFHRVDPRSVRLLALVDAAVAEKTVSGRFANIARTIEKTLESRKGKPVPLNIDGASAVVFTELGFPPPLARGLFCISRSVGLLAHAWEQTGKKERNKGPMPREFPYLYTGPAERHLKEETS